MPTAANGNLAANAGVASRSSNSTHLTTKKRHGGERSFAGKQIINNVNFTREKNAIRR